ncbi:hypothetical protein [Flavobacterium sp. 5]|uniref:hypothetical protein n=1 Tax=Flavobacterium sp. 5 TaxID=2035199 RepID=UPI000C2CC21D|nr:hypothetical protein [Flavobacterium sp. 5]PKB18300.1 hypothetical protein CLU82_3570 [Flavobacterium sp. 5]
MTKNSTNIITDIILDFDGTCTQIDLIYKAYLRQYLLEINKLVPFITPISNTEWKEAQNYIIANSPKASWTIATTPAAPAAADPYILAFESAKLVMRKQGIKTDPPFEAHSNSNNENQAPFRTEARDVFSKLLEKEINIHFISNSDSTKITKRLCDLFERNNLPPGISVESEANKFRICEITLEQSKTTSISNNLRKTFEDLPAIHSSISVDGRPVYLRRAFYFEAICKALSGDISKLSSSIFCGDIWEMDLAMPKALGANIHLIERSSPFETYEYEREMVLKNNGKVSFELNGLMGWF